MEADVIHRSGVTLLQNTHTTWIVTKHRWNRGGGGAWRRKRGVIMWGKMNCTNYVIVNTFKEISIGNHT